MADAAAPSPTSQRAPGRPPRSQAPDLRVFAAERLLAGLAQAREAVRSLTPPSDSPAHSVHQALVADVGQAEATARTLRRVLEAS